MKTLSLTSTGTPNTCCVCGKMQKTKWYAKNEDMARSGQGLCPPCGKKAEANEAATQKTLLEAVEAVAETPEEEVNEAADEAAE